MWRYVKEPLWNLEIREPSCGTIPYNYISEQIVVEVPLYFHYKCYDLSWEAYLGDGSSAKSSLNTGLPRPVKGFDDLFFDEDRPFEDGYLILIKTAQKSSNALEILHALDLMRAASQRLLITRANLSTWLEIAIISHYLPYGK
jgi:hypothetical protein